MFDKRNNRKINKSLNHYPKLAGLLYTFTNVEELLLRKHISGWNERGNESKTAKPQWLLAKPTYQETLKGIPKPSVSESWKHPEEGHLITSKRKTTMLLFRASSFPGYLQRRMSQTLLTSTWGKTKKRSDKLDTEELWKVLKNILWNSKLKH